MNFMDVTAVALWFDAISIIAHVTRMNTIKHSMLQVNASD